MRVENKDAGPRAQPLHLALEGQRGADTSVRHTLVLCGRRAVEYGCRRLGLRGASGLRRRCVAQCLGVLLRGYFERRLDCGSGCACCCHAGVARVAAPPRFGRPLGAALCSPCRAASCCCCCLRGGARGGCCCSRGGARCRRNRCGCRAA